MILATYQCQHSLCCSVEPSLLLSSLVTVIKNSIATDWMLMIIANLWIMEVVVTLVREVMVVVVITEVVVMVLVDLPMFSSGL